MNIPWDLAGWLFGGIATAFLIGMLIWTRKKFRNLADFQLELKKRERMEKLLEEKEATQESIIYFAKSLFRQNTVDDILWDVAVNCIDKLGFVDCVIYLLDEERQVLVQKAAFGPKNDRNLRIVDPIEIPVGKGIVGAVCESGRTEAIMDVRLDERYILDDEQRLSELAVPLVSPEGKVLGVIDSEHPERAFFSPSHVIVLETIASICAIKIIKARADAEIILAKEAAESATRAKSQFLSTMSHEIRTPLYAVIGTSHLLLDNNPTDSQLDNLNTLHFSANQLLSLVNDILDFSKLESGKVSLEEHDFDLPTLCRNLKQTFAQAAKSKHLELRLKAPQLNFHIAGDSARLNQVLTNLIGNAIKFTKEGQIDIQYEVEKESKSDLQLLFKVKDTGIGIPANKLDRIFQQFEQASSDTNRRFGGTGLGLAITKKLVDLQGGEIGVNSQPGVGTEFWFRLGYKKGSWLGQGGTQQVEVPDWKYKTLPGMRVLLVEDNPINRKIGSKFLKKWQIDLQMAEDGLQALNILQENPAFDLVLMDLNMPVMGGLEATRHIRNLPDPIYQSLPIVALTADASQEVKAETRASGMTDFLTKPFDVVRLFSLLEKAHKQKVLK